MDKPYWIKKRKNHRHEFRTDDSEEEVINRLLDKKGGTTSKLIIDALKEMDRTFTEE